MEVMVERLREVVVVEVHQWLGHLPWSFLPIRQKRLWLLRLSSWNRGLLPWQVSSIDRIQEVRLPHLMGEMISLIWLV